MSELLVDRSDGVLRLTLNAPQFRNAVDTPLLHALADEILADTTPRVAVLRGAGGSFCAGARLSSSGPNPGFLDAAHRLVEALTSAPFPVIAAVDGPTAGVGCSIAYAADLVVAAERSYFLHAFVRIGLMPDGGGAELMAASLGRARALWLALTGARLAAEDAFTMGLIGACVPDDDFDATVEGLVDQLATGPTLGLAQTKAAINQASIPTLAATFDFENSAQTALLASDDYAEGVAAFLAKRTPRFQGR